MRKQQQATNLSTTQRKYRAWYSVYGFILLSLLVGNIFISARHIYLGRQVSLLEKEQQQLMKKQSELANSIASYSSLSELKAQATTEGFSPITQTMVMNVPDTNAVALGE